MVVKSENTRSTFFGGRPVSGKNNHSFSFLFLQQPVADNPAQDGCGKDAQLGL